MQSGRENGQLPALELGFALGRMITAVRQGMRCSPTTSFELCSPIHFLANQGGQMLKEKGCHISLCGTVKCLCHCLQLWILVQMMWILVQMSDFSYFPFYTSFQGQWFIDCWKDLVSSFTWERNQMYFQLLLGYRFLLISPPIVKSWLCWFNEEIS